MISISAHERASVERRIESLKEVIYRLALVPMSEGVRAERLRTLLTELRQLEAATKSA